MVGYRCLWTFFFVSTVARSAVFAFRIPGLSSGGKSAPNGNGKAPGMAASSNHPHSGEYVGPVFIIRELDKANGQYDAFVTTGGIQEVKPAVYPGYGVQQQQQQQQQQQPAGALREPDEDSEYFGVLVTPDTVRLLGYSNSAAINVSLPALLSAVSSRIPWLLVLRRKDYPVLFEYHQQQQQQQRLPGQQQQQQPQLAVPGTMQIPQRRRYRPDRKRRALSAYGYDDYKSDANEERKRHLTSPFNTMCSHFNLCLPAENGDKSSYRNGTTPAPAPQQSTSESRLPPVQMIVP